MVTVCGPRTKPSRSAWMLKETEAWPAGMTTCVGMDNSVGSALARATVSVAAMLPLRVTVAITGWDAPSLTWDRFTCNVSSAGTTVAAGATVRLLVSLDSTHSLRESATTASQRLPMTEVGRTTDCVRERLPFTGSELVKRNVANSCAPAAALLGGGQAGSDA